MPSTEPTFDLRTARDRAARRILAAQDAVGRACAEAQWRRAYFALMRLTSHGDVLAVEGHVFTRLPDRLDVAAVANRERIAS